VATYTSFGQPIVKTREFRHHVRGYLTTAIPPLQYP
jgi:hypothetical protein